MKFIFIFLQFLMLIYNNCLAQNGGEKKVAFYKNIRSATTISCGTGASTQTEQHFLYYRFLTKHQADSILAGKRYLPVYKYSKTTKWIAHDTSLAVNGSKGYTDFIAMLGARLYKPHRVNKQQIPE